MHEDVAAYLLGGLDPEERSRFEEHLDGCERCRSELEELAAAAVLLEQAGSSEEPPEGLKIRTMMAVERAAAVAGPPAAATTPPARRPRLAWPRRLALAGVAAALVAMAALGGLLAGERRQPGTVEVDARLRAPSGDGVAAIRVTEVGIGRIVALETSSLPSLDNDEEFYELWFVGPDDTAATPNRVSAGTFHPDASGKTSVRLTAAVVPANYPRLSVTREPRDGDPRSTGREVLGSAG